MSTPAQKQALRNAKKMQQQALDCFNNIATMLEDYLQTCMLAETAGVATAILATTKANEEVVEVQKEDAGVLLIALGHPYYGEMAANLAASIRFTDKLVPIHLVWAGNALDHLQKEKLALFTSMQKAPEESYNKNGKRAFFKAKTFMYDFSPYTKTLFLDVDMLWLTKRPVSSFLDELNGVKFTIQNRDLIDLEKVQAPEAYNDQKKPPFYLWAKVPELKKAYGFEGGKLYGLHSELVYFEKCEATAKLFESIKETYQSPKVEPIVFAGDMADELAFAIAMIQHDVHPHKTPFSPIYWWKLDGKNGVPHRIPDLASKFIAYSVGGNIQPRTMATVYDLMAKVYAKAVGVTRVWTLKNKKQFITERQKL